MLELSSFQPVKDLRVNSCGFFCCQIWTIFEVIVLPFLLSLEIKTSQAAEVFLAHRFVDCCSSSDSFSVVVGGICPPIGFRLNITNNHVLNRHRESWNLPGDVCFPATPRLAQMLQNCLRLVCLDSFWHHVTDIFDDS